MEIVPDVMVVGSVALAVRGVGQGGNWEFLDLIGVV